MESKKLKLYEMRSQGYLTTFSAAADIQTNAIASNDWSNPGPRFLDDYLRKGYYPSWLQFPVVFHQYDEGKVLRDFLDTRIPSFYLISQRTKELLEKEQATGWISYPIKLFTQKGQEIFGYHGFSITGRAGLVHYPNGRDWPFFLQKESMIYNLQQWDGSDICLLRGGIIVTERVMKLFKKENINALRFIPLEDLYTIVSN